MIEGTIYLNEESTRKQLTMPFWAYDWIKSNDGESLSKGQKVYEVLFMVSNEYEDSLTETESFVDDQLESLTSERFVETVEKIKSQKAHDPESEYDSDDRVSDVNLQIPPSLDEQITQRRYIGDMIAEKVSEYIESAYSDRLDRLDCKKELVRWFQDNRTSVENRVAKAIVEGDESEFNVEEAHQQLQLLREDNWWESDSVTVDILLERGTDIPQGVSNRATALQTSIRNADGDYTEEEIYNLADNIFEVGEKTIEKYVEAIDMRSTSSDTVYVDMMEIARQVLESDEEVDEDYEEYLGLEESELLEGEYPKGKVVDEIESLLDEIYQNNIIGTPSHTDVSEYKSIRDWLKALRGMLDETHTEEDDEGAQNAIRMVALEE